MKSNGLWFAGNLESGTIVCEHEGGLVVERGLSDSQVKAICECHNMVVKILISELNK